jgi:DNA-binding transcriptional MocR family regulator
MSIQTLLKMLTTVENDNSIKEIDYLQESTTIICNIVNLANDLLITDDGKCHYENMSILENNNFNIFPLEMDSFGWLVAGIQTNKGVIVYG